MAPSRTRLVLAAAAAVVAVLASMMLGGGIVTAVLCAFALMIGGPIAILAWLGSLTDRDAKRQAQARKLKLEKFDAALWQRTLEELEPAWPEIAQARRAAALQIAPRKLDAGNLAEHARSAVAGALAGSRREGRRFARPILGLSVAILSTFGFSACGVPPEAWAAVRPGMGTAELVSIAGGPDYVRSNGQNEVWQYCRDFYGRDEGRFARYYTTVLVSNQTVQDVRPYPVLSDAGCQEFYRANF